SRTAPSCSCRRIRSSRASTVLASGTPQPSVTDPPGATLILFSTRFTHIRQQYAEDETTEISFLIVLHPTTGERGSIQERCPPLFPGQPKPTLWSVPRAFRLMGTLYNNDIWLATRRRANPGSQIQDHVR